MQNSIPSGFTTGPRPVSSVPRGFDRVIPVRHGHVTAPGISIYRDGQIAMSKDMRTKLRPDDYPRLVVAISPSTSQLYIGPAGPEDLSHETFTNPSSGLINAKSVNEATSRVGMEPGNFYPVYQLENGWVTKGLS
jgi:hypothetical protein